MLTLLHPCKHAVPSDEHRILSRTAVLALLAVCMSGVCSRAAQGKTLPDRRPALIGSGPRSLVNLIDVQNLMQKGQRRRD
jgi:hypothetical protein